MAFYPGGRTIRGASLSCRAAFEECQSIKILNKEDWAEDRLADFNLWANGSGAVSIDRVSLDRRLHAVPDVRNAAIRSVEILLAAVQDCLRAAREADRQPAEDASGTSDYEEYKSSVENIAKQLFRLHSAIRKSGTQSRLARADQYFDRSRHEELDRELTAILLGSTAPSSLKTAGAICLFGITDYTADNNIFATRIDGMLPSTSEVRSRLIRANLIRRSRFIYQQRHQRILATEPAFSTTSRPEEEVEASAPVAASPPRAAEQAADLPPVAPISGQTQRVPSTDPTAISKNVKVSEGSQKSKTVLSRITCKAEYPKGPESHVRDGQELFNCPACCQSLSVSYLKGGPWMKHLVTDLMPYTCVLEDCPKPFKFYRTSKEWRIHMTKEHVTSRYWICLPCSEDTAYNFTDQEAFYQHLRSQHSETISEDQFESFASVCSRTAAAQLNTCPLCPEHMHQDVDPSTLLDHVAEHIHTFSLYSLPWPKPGEKEGEWIREGRRDPNDSGDYFDRPENPYFDDASEEISGRASLDEESENAFAVEHTQEQSTASIGRHPEQSQPSSSPILANSIEQSPRTVKGHYYVPLGDGRVRRRSIDNQTTGGSKLNRDNLTQHTLAQPPYSGLHIDPTDVSKGSLVSDGDVNFDELAIEVRDRQLATKDLPRWGAKPNVQDRRNVSALHTISMSKDELHQTIQYITEGRIDFNAQRGRLESALRTASALGDRVSMRILLKSGTDVNAVESGKRSALQEASAAGRTNIVRLLLSYGADVNARGGWRSPLQDASAAGHHEMVDLLITWGADVNVLGDGWRSPLQEASEVGSEPCVRTLISRGAMVNALSPGYRSALQSASLWGYENIVELLLRNGADIYARHSGYKSALQAASANGHADVVKLLLEYGADVDAEGDSVMQAAAAGGSLDIVKLLWLYGADVEKEGGRYGNALYAAAKCGHLEILSFLEELRKSGASRLRRRLRYKASVSSFSSLTTDTQTETEEEEEEKTRNTDEVRRRGRVRKKKKNRKWEK